jgi:hypothetical protein
MFSMVLRGKGYRLGYRVTGRLGVKLMLFQREKESGYGEKLFTAQKRKELVHIIHKPFPVKA